MTKILPFVTFGLDKSGFCGIIKAPKIPFGLLERYTFVEAKKLHNFGRGSCPKGRKKAPPPQDAESAQASIKVYLFGGRRRRLEGTPNPAFADVRSSALQRVRHKSSCWEVPSAPGGNTTGKEAPEEGRRLGKAERCKGPFGKRGTEHRGVRKRRASRGKRQTQRVRETGGLEQGTDTETSGKAEGLAKNTRRKP